MTPHKKRTKKHKKSFLDSLWIEYKFNMNEEKGLKKFYLGVRMVNYKFLRI
jgi:hypothetical protein